MHFCKAVHVQVLVIRRDCGKIMTLTDLIVCNCFLIVPTELNVAKCLTLECLFSVNEEFLETVSKLLVLLIIHAVVAVQSFELFVSLTTVIRRIESLVGSSDSIEDVLVEEVECERVQVIDHDRQIRKFNQEDSLELNLLLVPGAA